MIEYFLPLERLLRYLRQEPQYLPIAYAAGAGVLVVALLIILYFRKYFTFISKSLFRNLLRTILSGVAIMVLVFVMTLIWSILLFLDLAMTERAKDLKAIVTERYQIPSQLPFAYAAGLEEGAVRSDHPEDVRPLDSMTWQFFGGSLDPDKRTFENSVFFFAMDPHKIRSMMDELDVIDKATEEKMIRTKIGVLVGRERLRSLKKRVGDHMTVTSFNYKDIVLEFEIVGQLPEGRYDGSAIMNRDYLNDALDDYKNKHNGEKHPMADKTLNLVWLRVPDSSAFQQVADQVMTSSKFTAPYVKCETASSGIASFLDAYQDLIWGAKFLLVPAILATMSLVVANAISISVRERRTEMAVLKVLGYGPGRILAMVLGEAVLVGAGGGFLSAAMAYLFIHVFLHGIAFPIAFFGKFDLWADCMWWGFLFGGLTSLAGSFVPAWSARSVKVSEVFAKVG
jgi:putative ABC transport system permease protein